MIHRTVSVTKQRLLSNRNCLPALALMLVCYFGPAWIVAAKAQRNSEEKPAAGNQDVITLELGKPIERELVGGQTHTYQVTIAPGEFLRTTVDQRGIDVAVTLFSPDGKKLIEVDSPNGEWGPEPCLWIADTAGIYRLDVRSPEKTAAAGRYEVQMTERRLESATDRDLVEALTLYLEADRLMNQVKFNEALAIAQRSLTLREKALGPDHLEVAPTLHQLARLYARVVDSTNAEKFFQRALHIYERAFGPEHPELATVLNNFALVYYARADFTKAIPLLDRAIEIYDKKPGSTPNYVPTLCNLGQMYYYTGDHPKAESLYKRALVVGEKTLASENHYLAYCLTNLGNLYNTNRRFTEAQPLFQRALAIREKMLPPGHPDIGVTLQGLGTLYLRTGETTKAKQTFQQAIPILEKLPGQALLLVDALQWLGRIDFLQGNKQQALSYFSRAIDVLDRFFSNHLTVSSERQRLVLMSLVSSDLDFFLSLRATQASTDTALLELALTRLLQIKGRIFDVQNDIVAKIRRSALPKDQALFDQLAETRSRLAKMAISGPGREKPDVYRAQLKQAEENVEKLEIEISSRSTEFEAQMQPVTLAAMKAILPQNVALLEFSLYRQIESHGRQPGSPFYVAFIILSQGQPSWVNLGDATSIDQAIDDWRKALRDPKRRDVNRLARAVDEKVMRPVRALLGDARHLLIAPDGKLNLIPLAALVDEQNRYLAERYSLGYLTSGRDLLRMQAARESRSEPLVVANPAFGNVARAAAPIRQNDTSQSREDQRGQFFGPLNGTAEEAAAIKKLFPRATVYTEARATEAAIKQAVAPSILHIATHGFFLADQDPPPADARGSLTDDPLRTPDTRLAKWATQLENPLLRSGLALAGANEGRSGPNGEDDGLLTAMEAASLNLWGTKLVVLSACDTGMGEVKNGEGVYGLRRAFVLAGAETLVMSLWPVSDRETKNLMIPYYAALKRGAGRGEALRQVQLQLIRSKGHRHPFYWASFIQSGEWANLEGKR